MNAFYSELQWLPRAPEELPQRLKALGNSTGPLGRELQALASYSHDLNQLTKLAKAIGKTRGDGKSLAPLVPFRLAVLSNSTIDMIVPALVATAARHGVALEVIQPSYDQVAQEALTPDSKVNSSKPDAVLLALDYRALPLKLTLGERGVLSHGTRSSRLFTGASQRHQGQFQCCLHLPELRSACGTTIWQP